MSQRFQLREHRSDTHAEPGPGPFMNVSEAARLMRMSDMTLYRAIAAGEFPAVRIRGRLIIPTRAIEEMIDRALAEGISVDAAAWVRADVGAGS